MGGGFTLLMMPLVYEAINRGGITAFVAWRWSFLVPGCFQLLMTAGVLFLAQDLPDGNYTDLKKSGAMRKQNAWRTWKAALINYR
jgi:NNP family nitrate/nitrite transporter-like MFS transporter